MKRKKHSHRKGVIKTHNHGARRAHSELFGHEQKKKLEIVLKCDSVGSEEAVISSLEQEKIPEVELRVIHSGVGSITKSDVLMALTGSKIVIGFNVDILPKIRELCREQNIEVRLYDVIYQLTHNLKEIAQSLIPREAEQKITGKGKVIALFKSSRKGIILGCEVMEGKIALDNNFRVISAMGPIHTGKIESLHIEKDAVQVAKIGQQVGVKISNFNKAKVGDQIECFVPGHRKVSKPWEPTGQILRLQS
jgi:translation initiation factor IF-2